MGDKMYAAILNQKLVLAINEAEQVSKGLKKVESRILSLSILSASNDSDFIGRKKAIF